ncbi:MAG: cysteine desulfurase family protein [Pseudonocardiaceae bacterium]
MADTAEAKQRRTLYFDYQATTPADPGVVAAMLPFFSGQFGNAGSHHSYGTAAAVHVAAARQQVAQLIGALSPDEIIFTSGATESNAIVIQKVFATAERAHFVTTVIEHPSVLDPAAELARAGHEVSYLAVDRQGRVDPVQVESLIRPETRLVSVMHANNEVGTIQPLADISRITRAADVLLHADLTQTAGALEVDVQDLGVELASLSAHKFYGPKGIGALYVRRGCSLRKGPGRTGSALRPGTLNVPGIVGMGAAAELAVARRVADGIHAAALRTRFVEALLGAMPDAFVNGHPTQRIPGNLSVTFPGVEVDEVLQADPDLGLAMGSACTSGRTEPSHVLLALGLSRTLSRSTLRIGFGRATEWDDCHDCVERLVPLLMRSRSRSRVSQDVSTGKAK